VLTLLIFAAMFVRISSQNPSFAHKSACWLANFEIDLLIVNPVEWTHGRGVQEESCEGIVLIASIPSS
jgi:hypothetical protein